MALSLLGLCAEHGSIGMAHLLLNAGASPQLASKLMPAPPTLLVAAGAGRPYVPPSERLPLHVAALRGRTDRCEFVRLLLDHGSDPHARDSRGLTALQLAQQWAQGDQEGKGKMQDQKQDKKQGRSGDDDGAAALLREAFRRAPLPRDCAEPLADLTLLNDSEHVDLVRCVACFTSTCIALPAALAHNPWCCSCCLHCRSGIAF